MSVESPCIRFCQLSSDLSYCKGCGRTIEQIRLWWIMDDQKRLEALAEAEHRKESSEQEEN